MRKNQIGHEILTPSEAAMMAPIMQPAWHTIGHLGRVGVVRAVDVDGVVISSPFLLLRT
jgi:hypothetical protein